MGHPSTKRRFNNVDHVGDEGPEPKVHRAATAPTQRFGEDTSFIPLTQTEDDDAEAEGLIQGSQDVDVSSAITVMLYGEIRTKIVGVRFYSGHATIGETVILRRQADNPYDSNAIRVENVMRDQIGHIPRVMAAKLAKYMDQRTLILEGVLTGVIGAFDCPILVRLFGPSDPARRQGLKSQMEADKLPLADFKRQEREETRRKKEQEKVQKAADKKARALALGKGMQYQGQSELGLSNLMAGEGISEENLEDIIGQSSAFNPRDIGQVTENFGLSESDLANMPMADVPPALSTQLLPYQRQGLAWMMDKENPCHPTTGSDDVVQLWKRDGHKFRNIATNYSTSNAPPLASGGILADDMGLGKTIQVISLVLASPQPKTSGATTTTLIISPVGVMSNWKDQMNDHTHRENAPRVLIYHGSGKKEAGNLAQYDVVVTSYGALAMEYKPDFQKKPAKGLFSTHWRRVVLDEGHTIRNPRSKGALAACHLLADSRWTLTGTPIINSLKDLYSQIRFLGLTGGLEDPAVFNGVLVRPLMYEDPNARLLLQALMSTLCLRRRKDMGFVNLRLPPLASRVLRVKFHPHEQEKYDMFQYACMPPSCWVPTADFSISQIRSQGYALGFQVPRQIQHDVLQPPRGHPAPPASLQPLGALQNPGRQTRQTSRQTQSYPSHTCQHQNPPREPTDPHREPRHLPHLPRQSRTARHHRLRPLLRPRLHRAGHRAPAQMPHVPSRHRKHRHARLPRRQHGRVRRRRNEQRRRSRPRPPQQQDRSPHQDPHSQGPSPKHQNRSLQPMDLLPQPP